MLIDPRKTPLKRIFLGAGLLLLAASASLSYFYMRPAEASARVLLGPGRAFVSYSEILTPPVMERAAAALYPRILPPAEKRKKAAALLKKAKVRPEFGGTAARISFRHRNPGEASRTVNAIAAAFGALNTERAGEEAALELRRLDAEIRVTEEDIAAAENQLRVLEKENEPDAADLQLARLYQDAQARHKELSKTFKETYPELMKLQMEMKSLEAQIMDGSFHGTEIMESARKDLAELSLRHKTLLLRRETPGSLNREVGESLTVLPSIPSEFPFLTKFIRFFILPVGWLLTLLFLFLALRCSIRRDIV